MQYGVVLITGKGSLKVLNIFYLLLSPHTEMQTQCGVSGRVRVSNGSGWWGQQPVEQTYLTINSCAP